MEKIAILGDEKYPELVIKALEQLGGKNVYGSPGDNSLYVYLLNHLNEIVAMDGRSFDRRYPEYTICTAKDILGDSYDELVYKIKQREFCQLHKKIMNEIVEFCHEYDIDATDGGMKFDNMITSIDEVYWHPSMDSSFVLYKDRLPILESM